MSRNVSLRELREETTTTINDDLSNVHLQKPLQPERVITATFLKKNKVLS